MTNLTIINNNLSLLNAVKFAMAITKLTTANIGPTRLTPHQVTTLMVAITKKQNKLKHLQIGRTDLSKIEPKLIGAAFNKLEIVNAGKTNLTDDQINEIINQKLIETPLTILYLNVINEKLQYYDGKLTNMTSRDIPGAMKKYLNLTERAKQKKLHIHVFCQSFNWRDNDYTTSIVH
jgi:hypothetical protein